MRSSLRSSRLNIRRKGSRTCSPLRNQSPSIGVGISRRRAHRRRTDSSSGRIDASARISATSAGRCSSHAVCNASRHTARMISSARAARAVSPPFQQRAPGARTRPETPRNAAQLVGRDLPVMLTVQHRHLTRAEHRVLCGKPHMHVEINAERHGFVVPANGEGLMTTQHTGRRLSCIVRKTRLERRARSADGEARRVNGHERRRIVSERTDAENAAAAAVRPEQRHHRRGASAARHRRRPAARPARSRRRAAPCCARRRCRAASHGESRSRPTLRQWRPSRPWSDRRPR